MKYFCFFSYFSLLFYSFHHRVDDKEAENIRQGTNDILKPIIKSLSSCLNRMLIGQVFYHSEEFFHSRNTCIVKLTCSSYSEQHRYKILQLPVSPFFDVFLFRRVLKKENSKPDNRYSAFLSSGYCVFHHSYYSFMKKV